MAEVAPAANAVEINDALFCQHFKEVVSITFSIHKVSWMLKFVSV